MVGPRSLEAKVSSVARSRLAIATDWLHADSILNQVALADQLPPSHSPGELVNRLLAALSNDGDVTIASTAMEMGTDWIGDENLKAHASRIRMQLQSGVDLEQFLAKIGPQWLEQGFGVDLLIDRFPDAQTVNFLLDHPSDQVRLIYCQNLHFIPSEFDMRRLSALKPDWKLWFVPKCKGVDSQVMTAREAHVWRMKNFECESRLFVYSSIDDSALGDGAAPYFHDLSTDPSESEQASWLQKFIFGPLLDGKSSSQGWLWKTVVFFYRLPFDVWPKAVATKLREMLETIGLAIQHRIWRPFVYGRVYRTLIVGTIAHKFFLQFVWGYLVRDLFVARFCQDLLYAKLYWQGFRRYLWDPLAHEFLYGRVYRTFLVGTIGHKLFLQFVWGYLVRDLFVARFCQDLLYAKLYWQGFRRYLWDPIAHEILYGRVYRTFLVGTIGHKFFLQFVWGYLVRDLFVARFCQDLLYAKLYWRFFRGRIWDPVAKVFLYGYVYRTFLVGVVVHQFGLRFLWGQLICDIGYARIWRDWIFARLYWRFIRGWGMGWFVLWFFYPIRKLYWFSEYQYNTRLRPALRGYNEP